MNIEKKPFVNYTLDEEREDKDDIRITIRLNKEEQELLNQVRSIWQQQKDGTLIKHLMMIGYYDVIHNDKMKYFTNTVSGNVRRNKRTGLVNFD